MLIVQVICSDPDCTEEFEAVVQTLDQLDDLVCECDCSTVLLGVAELRVESNVIQFPARRDMRPIAA